jgi:hypothetical protein
MNIPAINFWTANDKITYDVAQARITAPLQFLLNPPKVRVRKNTSQLLATGGTGILVPWSYEEVDTDNMFNPATPTRITPKTPGWYVGDMGLTIGTTALNPTTGIKYLRCVHSDTTTLGQHRFPSTGTAGKPQALRDIPVFGYFNGTTDYCEVLVFQTSGSTISIAEATDVNDHGTFSLRWVSV